MFAIEHRLGFQSVTPGTARSFECSRNIALLKECPPSFNLTIYKHPTPSEWGTLFLGTHSQRLLSLQKLKRSLVELIHSFKIWSVCATIKDDEFGVPDSLLHRECEAC